MKVNIGDLQVNPRFDNLLHALHPTELEILQESIVAEGIRDPIKVWGETIVDGHNRYRIARDMGITEVEVDPLEFDSEIDAEEWILRNQIGRRNTPEHLRNLYIGQLYQLLKAEVGSDVAVSQLMDANDISRRSVFRHAGLATAFDQVSETLQDRFVAGKATASEVIADLKDVPKPENKYDPAVMAQNAEDAFPNTVKLAAFRIAQTIDNLRVLCNDAKLIFENDGEDLRKYAPELCAMGSKLLHEEAEAKVLQTLVKCPETHIDQYGKFIASSLAEMIKEEQEFKID